MGAQFSASASRVWTELCAIQSDQVRARVLERVLSSERGLAYVEEGRRAGVYSPVLTWLTAYRSGLRTPWPYQTVPYQTESDGPDPIELVIICILHLLAPVPVPVKWLSVPSPRLMIFSRTL
jgi:hypothetical protein